MIACVGSDKETGDSARAAPTLEVDLRPIFNRNCTGSCHAAAAPAEGMDLSAGVAHANLVGVVSAQVPSLERVTPGDPDASYLIDKLEATHVAAGGTGTSMPPELILASNELTLFRDWIATGAAE
ncbi:MAG: hypothetical protein Q8P41_05995 [Pseudomonadota bacterium]|nr:hypothetical protein [Pseudomonadota bacterium]